MYLIYQMNKQLFKFSLKKFIETNILNFCKNKHIVQYMLKIQHKLKLMELMLL